MIIITSQHHLSLPILYKKLRKGKDHRIAIQLLCPTIGVCVDGHHDYMASLYTHRPLNVVTVGPKFSEENTGAGLLDYWHKRGDAFEKTEEWQFYNLHTGEPIPVKMLKGVVDLYPDYTYSV